MNPIKFFTNPGDELFIPTVSHPGEDAGADIRAYVKDGFDREAATDFYRDFESQSLKYGTRLYIREAATDFYREVESQSLKYGTRLYVDGEVFTSESEVEFLRILDECGGAVMLAPGETVKVHAGFKVILPSLKELGHPWSLLLPVYKIVPRSGLANNHGIVVTNSPGIIDAGYQDWVQVSLTNQIGVGEAGDNYHVFTHGSRIAQGLCEMVIDQSNLTHTTNPAVFTNTARGLGGFGSTNL